MGLAPGSKLGPYEIVALLGAGGMGEVYKARDPRLNRFVALKVLPADKVNNPERTQRFTQEARAASALNHPNIVTIYEIGEGDAGHFIAMEFVPGKTLSEQIPKKGLPLKNALNYAIQIADACAAAHAAGIVHRDLKPGNVMVTENGTVKVLDFGLAKLVESAPLGESDDTETDQPRTQDGMILGTASYMSPEQAKGKKLDARSDIFSFGSLLYEMLTGRRAFEGDSKITTLAAILDKEPESLESQRADIPRDVVRVVQRCLQKLPERRAQGMADVKLELEEAKQDSESGRSAPAHGRKSGRKVVLAAAAAALLLAIGGAAIWVWRGSPAPEVPIQAVPLTSYPGEEREPKLSPDGNQVAFVWNGETQDNWDIYVKLLGPDRPLRITTHPARDASPVWSPDGRSIAFLRFHRGQRQLLIVPALGGPEREVVPSKPTFFVSLTDWTPDGRWLVTTATADSGRIGIYLVSVANGDVRRATPGATSPEGDAYGSISPDGRSMAFARRTASTAAGDIYLVALTPESLAKGEPKRITSDGRIITRLDWTADGREIVYSVGGIAAPRGASFGNLWRVGANGADKPRLIPLGEGGAELSVSRRGNRLVYSQTVFDDNIWRTDLSNRGAPPIPLISSTRTDSAPDYSPDGKKIAFVSSRSGNSEVWLCDADGSNPSQLTSVGRAGHPHWSPDGEKIVFASEIDGITQIFTIRSRGGASQRITRGSTNNVRPSWSRNGKWIYFVGAGQVSRVARDGGEPTQITKKRGFLPYDSTDGKTIYYLKTSVRTAASLWKVPAEGGEEELVLEGIDGWSFSVRPEGIYFIRERTMMFYDFAKKASSVVQKLNKEPSTVMAVSPDGRWALYTQVDHSGSDLMLVENFR